METALEGFASALEAFASTIESFETARKGFAGTIKSFESTIKGFESTVERFASAVESFESTIEGFASGLKAFGGTIKSVASALKDSESALYFKKTQGERKMAKNKRLSPNDLAKEKGYFANLKKIEGYDPRNPAYTVEAIETVVERIDARLEREAQLLGELAEVRDFLAADCTTLVEKNDGAALQTAAQYGEDSTQYQSLGRKRKSERKTGGRRSGNNAPDA